MRKEVNLIDLLKIMMTLKSSRECPFNSVLSDVSLIFSKKWSPMRKNGFADVSGIWRIQMKAIYFFLRRKICRLGQSWDPFLLSNCLELEKSHIQIKRTTTRRCSFWLGKTKWPKWAYLPSIIQEPSMNWKYLNNSLSQCFLLRKKFNSKNKKKGSSSQ